MAPRSTRITRLLLTANVILLLMVCLLLIGRRVPAANAQTVTTANPTTVPILEIQPSQLSVMPAQVSPNGFGCYVLDSTHQTLSVYQYNSGDHELKFMGGRDISFDHRVKSYNTSPPPADIKAMVEHAETPSRVTGDR